MTDHPINLRDWQARACVEERLSVLVVPITPQPQVRFVGGWGICREGKPDEWTPLSDMIADDNDWHRWAKDAALPLIVGGRYWCRETWAPDPADGAPLWKARGSEPFDPADKPIRWRSPITMPRQFSRITIVPTEVRVCRLADVTEDDADGAVFGGGFPSAVLPHLFPDPDKAGARTIPECFGVVWNDQHGPGAYERNPWVTVGRVTVHLCNIDTLEADR